MYATEKAREAERVERVRLADAIRRLVDERADLTWIELRILERLFRDDRLAGWIEDLRYDAERGDSDLLAKEELQELEAEDEARANSRI